MKAAGWLAVVVAVVLAGMAIAEARSRALQSADNIRDGFAAAREGDQATLDRMDRESRDSDDTQHHEWIGAAVFLIAGIALIGAGGKRRPAAGVA